MNKEPGQTYWEAKHKDTPWSEAHEYARAKAREIEEACREGFVPQPLVEMVMTWWHAVTAGEQDLANYCGGQVLLTAAELVLGDGKEKLKDVRRLYAAQFKGPMEVGCSYSTRFGRTVECWHITGGIAHCTLGPHRAADGVSCVNREFDIVAKIQTDKTSEQG